MPKRKKGRRPLELSSPMETEEEDVSHAHQITNSMPENRRSLTPQGEGDGEVSGEQEPPEMAAASPPPPPDATVPDFLPAPNPNPTSRKQPAKRKKRMPGMKKKLAAIQKKIFLLNQNLRPTPFSPQKTIDFSKHELLFRALGLWDFAHLDLDQDIRSHLLVPLIANYDSSARRTTVHGARILVSRADLARALSLPVRKEKVNTLETRDSSELELFLGEEPIAVINDFIYNWMVFLDETSILPTEAVSATKLVKEGQPYKVDWAGLMWAMVEKEILEAPKSGKCCYALHLQRLIKHQRPKLFEEVDPVPHPEPELEAEPSMEVARVKEEDVTIEDFRDVGHNGNHTAGLSLGLRGYADAMVGLKESKGAEEEQLNSDGKDAGIEQCVQHCNLNDVTSTMECEDLSKGHGNGCAREQVGIVGGDLPLKFPSLERLTSSDFQAMEQDNNVSFHPPLPSTVRQSSGEFLTMGSETFENLTLDPGPGGLLLFANNCKREIDEIDDDDDDNEDVHGFSNQQKRLRSGGPWEETPSASAFDGCMEEVQCWMGKAKISLLEKEQTYMNVQLQLQYLNGLLQQKEQIIHSMEKARMEELQKRQVEMCRFEHELRVLSNVVYGYKKALKDTRNAFSEYRKQCSEGNGSVVLGTTEFEKHCLKKDGEEMRNIAVQMVKEFQNNWLKKFGGYTSWVEKTAIRLVELHSEFKLLKERFAEAKDQKV